MKAISFCLQQHRQYHFRRWFLCAFIVLLTGAVSTADGEANNTKSNGTQIASQSKKQIIRVSLGESGRFFVKLDKKSVKSGLIEFKVKNVGHMVHEFMVLKTTKLAAKLPTLPNGRVDEKKAGKLMGHEIGDIAPGESRTLRVTLRHGHYSLLCNLPGHYQFGQFTDLTVK